MFKYYVTWVDQRTQRGRGQIKKGVRQTLTNRLRILKYRRQNLRSMRDNAVFELKAVESEILALEKQQEFITSSEAEEMHGMVFKQSK